MLTDLVSREEFSSLQEKLEMLAQVFEDLMHRNEWNVYTNGELAKKLKVSARTLQNWRDQGIITYTQIGSKIYYTEQAVQLMMKNHERKTFGKGGRHE